MLTDGIFCCRLPKQIVQNRVGFGERDFLRPQASQLPDQILQVADILILIGKVLRPTVGEDVRDVSRVSHIDA